MAKRIPLGLYKAPFDKTVLPMVVHNPIHLENVTHIVWAYPYQYRVTFNHNGSMVILSMTAKDRNRMWKLHDS